MRGRGWTKPTVEIDEDAYRSDLRAASKELLAPARSRPLELPRDFVQHWRSLTRRSANV